MTRQTMANTFSRSRGGRALLHALCLARGRNVSWHLRGIVRELFDSRACARACACAGASADRPLPSQPQSRTPVPSPTDPGDFPLSRPSCRATTDPRASASAGAGAAKILPIVAALCAAIAPMTAAAAATTTDTDLIRLVMLPSAQVDSSGIFLDQITAMPGNSPQSLATRVRLAPAPAFGRATVLSRDQVLAALRQQQSPSSSQLPAIVWSGAEAVRVLRRARVLTEGDLRELLTSTLQSESVKDRGELELRFARPWNSVQVPDDALALKVLDLPSAGVSQHFVVRFELTAGDDRFGPFQAVVQARVMKNVLVAANPVRRGQSLEPADVTVERRDLLTLRDPLDDSALRGGALDFIENVSAGQPILARSVRPRPVVQRGMTVDGLIHDGPMTITLKVEVLADALPGQMVRVRNPKTKREFYAKVKDEQTVLINL